ncbi:MAG: RidA family protein [Actinobacteria bacterium]|nr:RidA family protein [Actinomycetota bacterium]
MALTKDIEYATGEGVPVPRGPYSPAVIWGDMVFVSGLLAVNPDGKEIAGDIREEAMVVLRNLKRLLEAAGSGLDKVLAVTVYISDIKDLPAFNEVYEEFFKSPYPSRSAVGVSLLGKFQVEVSAIAFK